MTSPHLELPWRPAEGQVPGTAILWRKRSYEVTGRTEAGSGARWTLRSWDGSSTMRNVFRLDHESVREVAARAEIELRNRRLRNWTLFALPILGLVPARLHQGVSQP